MGQRLVVVELLFHFLGVLAEIEGDFLILDGLAFDCEVHLGQVAWSGKRIVIIELFIKLNKAKSPGQHHFTLSLYLRMSSFMLVIAHSRAWHCAFTFASYRVISSSLLFISACLSADQLSYCLIFFNFSLIASSFSFKPLSSLFLVLPSSAIQQDHLWFLSSMNLILSDRERGMISFMKSSGFLFLGSYFFSALASSSFFFPPPMQQNILVRVIINIIRKGHLDLAIKSSFFEETQQTAVCRNNNHFYIPHFPEGNLSPSMIQLAYILNTISCL